MRTELPDGVTIGKPCIRRAKIPLAYNPRDGWTYDMQLWDVKVMAIAGGYAMARRPRSAPFVCRIDELEPK